MKTEYKVALPSPALLERFNRITEDLVDQIHNLIHRNHNLAATRDLLLPRLVLGEVEEVEKMKAAVK